MLVMTYSDARKNFASILDSACEEGAVLIRQADGSLFRLTPEKRTGSPFSEVTPVTRLSAGCLAAALEDARNSASERY